MKWDEMPFPWGMVRENEGARPLHYWLNWVFPFRPYLFSRVSFFPLFNEDGRESLHFSWRDSFVQWEPYLSSLHTFAKIATAIHIYIFFSLLFLLSLSGSQFHHNVLRTTSRTFCTGTRQEMSRVWPAKSMTKVIDVRFFFFINFIKERKNYVQQHNINKKLVWQRSWVDHIRLNLKRH